MTALNKWWCALQPIVDHAFCLWVWESECRNKQKNKWEDEGRNRTLELQNHRTPITRRETVFRDNIKTVGWQNGYTFVISRMLSNKCTQQKSFYVAPGQEIVVTSDKFGFSRSDYFRSPANTSLFHLNCAMFPVFYWLSCNVWFHANAVFVTVLTSRPEISRIRWIHWQKNLTDNLFFCLCRINYLQKVLPQRLKLTDFDGFQKNFAIKRHRNV